MSTAIDRIPPTDSPRQVERGRRDRLIADEVLARLAATASSTPRDLDEPLRRRVLDTCAAAFERDDPVALEDLHRALFAIYEASFANPQSPAAAHELSPWVVEMRELIEPRWLRRDEAELTLPDEDQALAMSPADVRAWFMEQAFAEADHDRDVVAYLRDVATLDDFRLFVAADAHLNYRFFDALVLSLLHFSEPVKTAISGHVWEEAGEGDLEESHTRQFSRCMERLGLSWAPIPTWEDWRPFAGHNLYFCFGLRRQHAFRALGSLAMPELFDVPRDQAIVDGLTRLGFDAQTDFAYYWNHVEADAQHGPGWLDDVILPIAATQPTAIRELMTGAALRMLAMRRFNAYLSERLGLASARV